jgi:hypothetical protein
MKQTTIIALIVITLSLTMTGCVAPTGEWEFDGTVKHVENETTSSPYSTPTPEVVYVTPTPEIIYVTVTPTPDPDPFICNDGELRDRSVCPDGQIIYAEYCDNNVWVPTGDVCPAPTPEPTPYLGHHRGGCAGLDQDLLRRYDFDNSGMINSNEMKTAKIGYENNYETQSDCEQILYAYEHRCYVRAIVSPTPEPTVLLPSLKVDYPVVAEFDIENRDRFGDMCHFIIKLNDDGRVFMNSDCEGQTVVGRWVLEYTSAESVETWVYSITAHGDTMPLHLKSGGKAELCLPDATEYGCWG